MYMYHSLCFSRTCLHHADVTAVLSLDYHSQQHNEQVYVLRPVIIVKCHSDDAPPYYTIHVIYTHNSGPKNNITQTMATRHKTNAQMRYRLLLSWCL